MKKKILLIMGLVILCVVLVGCSDLKATTANGSKNGAKNDVTTQKAIADVLAANQPTPTDIDYSLERYNLIRRTYWVNGQREKANMLVCPIEKPLGYIVLFAGNAVVGRFVVDGKVSSLNSYLTPDSEYYELVVVDGKVSSLNSYLTPDSEYYELAYGGTGVYKNKWLADVDGTYGENDSGIFFFTPDGKYVEWTGEYLYSDIPFQVENPTVQYEVSGDE